MKQNSYRPTWFLVSISGCLLMIGGYAAYAAVTWIRFGRSSHVETNGNGDSYLNELIPAYDIREKFELSISSPAEEVFAAACSLDLLQSRLIQTIFRIRELVLGSVEQQQRSPLGLVALAKFWGWAAMVERPGREIVFGAATQPWVARPAFRGLTSEEFLSFSEPDFVKIAWTLRADPIGRDRALIVTETRAIATDAGARRKFRIYWALVASGTALIRLVALRSLRNIAEHANAVRPG